MGYSQAHKRSRATDINRSYKFPQWLMNMRLDVKKNNSQVLINDFEVLFQLLHTKPSDRFS